MKNFIMCFALLLALSLSARSQFAKPLNSFAVVLQLGSEKLTEAKYKAAFDRVIFHQDVHGTLWRISEFGNIWTQISEKVQHANADAVVFVRNGIVQWKTHSAAQRRAEFYALNGILLGSLNSQSPGLSLSSYVNTVAVAVYPYEQVQGDDQSKRLGSMKHGRSLW